MRCRPFDDETRNALQALGFTISDDGEEAKIETEEKEITIDVVWPAHAGVWADNEFDMTIGLPNGSEISLKPTVHTLLNAAAK